MANKLTLGSITINFPDGYSRTPIKLETNERTLDGTLITNYSVSSGGIAVTKYHFGLSGIAIFPSTFTGSTGTSCSLEALGTTYTVHLLSESYELISKTSTGNLIKYNFVLEEE
jgi:hypothetical protein